MGADVCAHFHNLYFYRADVLHNRAGDDGVVIIAEPSIDLEDFAR